MTDEQGVQESLLAPYKRTRKGDPETSLAAAESVKELTLKQNAVLKVLKHVGPVTDEELRESYNEPDPVLWLLGMPDDPIPPQSDSGLRTRRSELRHRRLVRWTGEYRKLASGRMGRVWEAPDGQ